MEAGAANMACAHGQLTGSPGVCIVTRGPGAAHAAVGVHTARQGSVPMILLVGQVPRDHRGREAFQEVDIEAMFAPLAKWTATIDDPARIPEAIGRAVRVAGAGRPGPVVLALPEDMLAQVADVPDGPGGVSEPVAAPAPRPAAVARARDLVGRRAAAAHRRRWGGWSRRPRRTPPPWRSAGACRSPPPSAARTTSTTARRSMPARWGWAWIRGWPAAHSEADVLLVVGARAR